MTEGQRDVDRETLARLLDRLGFGKQSDKIDDLHWRVSNSSKNYHEKAAEEFTYREAHDSMRKTLQMAWSADPPIGQIRSKIAKLPPLAFQRIEDRKATSWERIFKTSNPAEGFVS